MKPARLAVQAGAALVLISMTVWALLGMLAHGDEGAVAAAEIATVAGGAPGRGVSQLPRFPAHSPSASDVLAFWAIAAQGHGVELNAVTVQENDAPDESPGLKLNTWQATLNLRGSYAALKRLMQDMAARHGSHLVWMNARWSRSNDVPQQASNLVELRLQLAWLQLPRSSLHRRAAMAR